MSVVQDVPIMDVCGGDGGGVRTVVLSRVDTSNGDSSPSNLVVVVVGDGGGDEGGDGEPCWSSLMFTSPSPLLLFLVVSLSVSLH